MRRSRLSRTEKVESLWVVEQIGRPIAKAWNARLEQFRSAEHTYREARTASQSPLPPTTSVTVTWQSRWSRIQASTQWMRERWSSRGGSSLVRLPTVPISQRPRCRKPWKRQRRSVWPSAVTLRWPLLWSALAVVGRTLLRTFSSESTGHCSCELGFGPLWVWILAPNFN